MLQIALERWRRGISIEETAEVRVMGLLIAAHSLIPFTELATDKHGLYNLEKEEIEMRGLSDRGFHRYMLQLLSEHEGNFFNRGVLTQEVAINILNYSILVDKVIDIEGDSTFNMNDTKKPVYTLNVNPKSELAEGDRQSIAYDTDRIPF